MNSPSFPLAIESDVKKSAGKMAVRKPGVRSLSTLDFAVGESGATYCVPRGEVSDIVRNCYHNLAMCRGLGVAYRRTALNSGNYW